MNINQTTSPAKAVQMAIRLGPVITSGAEGEIRECLSHPEMIAKVFTGTPTQISQKAVRIGVMLKMSDLKMHQRLAWPRVLFKSLKSFGYLMPRFRDTVTLVPLSAEILRRRLLPGFTEAHKARVAHDISAICARLEQNHVYVVDTSLANFLTTPKDGAAYLIDTDSLQFTTAAGHFSSAVYTPDFAAPEILRKPEALKNIGPEQARFTVALIMFQIYAQGSPYQVKDAASLEPAQQILHGRTFLGGRGRATGATSPELFARYRRLPPYVAHLFIRAFLHGHDNPAERPTFEEWVRVNHRYYQESRLAAAPV
jgi:DNA-binding helix-hairpin-helix protein with protein kinase domain